MEELELMENKFLPRRDPLKYIEISHNDPTSVRRYYNVRDGYSAPWNLELFQRERDALLLLRHRNIVQMLAHHEQNGFAIVELAYVSRTNLETVVFDSRYSYSISTVLSFWENLLDALIYLHSEGYVHRDVKPSNLLVDVTSVVLILADFETAKYYSRGQINTFDRGTAKFRPPESCLNYQLGGQIQTFGFKGDVYSSGLTIWELIERERCFQNLVDEDYFPSFEDEKPPLPPLECQFDEISEIVERCTTTVENQRYTAEQVLRDLIAFEARWPDLITLHTKKPLLDRARTERIRPTGL